MIYSGVRIACHTLSISETLEVGSSVPPLFERMGNASSEASHQWGPEVWMWTESEVGSFVEAGCKDRENGRKIL